MAINGKQNVTKISTDSQTSFYEMKLVSVNTHKLETSELLKNFVEMFKKRLKRVLVLYAKPPSKNTPAIYVRKNGGGQKKLSQVYQN